MQDAIIIYCFSLTERWRVSFWLYISISPLFHNFLTCRIFLCIPCKPYNLTVKAERLGMLQPQIRIKSEQFLIFLCSYVILEIILKAPIFSVLYQRLAGSGFSKNEQEIHLWPALKGSYKKGIFFQSLTFLLTLPLEIISYISVQKNFFAVFNSS